MSIETIYTALAAQGGTVSLDDASLGTAGLDALLSADGLPPAIQVTLPGALPPPNGDTLTFSGTSGFLAGGVQYWGGSNGFIDGAAFTVSVAIVCGENETVSLRVEVALADGWVLGDSFYAFMGGPFTADALTDPSLLFAYDCDGVADGLTLAADIHSVGPLVPLDLLAVVPDPARVIGRVTLETFGPAFQLVCPLGAVTLSYPPLQLSEAAYRLGLNYVPSPYEDPATGGWKVPAIANAFTAQCATSLTGEASVLMELGLGWADTISIVFLGNPEDHPAGSQAVLQPLFPTGSGFPGGLTTDQLTAIAGIGSFGVTSFALSGNPNAPQATYILGTLGITEPWTPIQSLPGFAVTVMNITWTYIFLDPPSLTWSLSAVLSLNGFDFALNVDYPSMSFAGNWAGSVTLSLNDLNAGMFKVFPAPVPLNPDVNSVTFGMFSVSVGFADQTVGIQGSAAGDIALSGLEVSITSATLNLLYSGKSGALAYAVNGVLAVNNWAFSVSAQVDADGLDLRGELQDHDMVSVSDVVGQLLGPVATPDQFDLSVVVRSFGASASTYTRRMAVWGGVDWDLVACGVSLGGTFAIDVASPDSGSSWTGTIGGGIVVGGLTFTMTYVWGPTVGLLTGAFSAAINEGATYDWKAFTQTFADSQPTYPTQIPVSLDLECDASLAFTYDFEQDLFTVNGQAIAGSVGMFGFFQEVPPAFTGRASSGFAAGVQFTAGPGFFRSLDTGLAMFDTFGLSADMAIAVADFTNPSYQIPINSHAYFPGVASGMTFYGSFTWDLCDDATTSGAMALMTREPVVEVSIGYCGTAENWTFAFAGVIDDIAWTLGDDATVNGAWLAFTMTGTAGDTRYEVLFDIDVSVDMGTGYVGTPGQPAVLDFSGQLGFLYDQATEGVAGFAAIFGSFVWRDALDIPGLTVANPGFLLGIGELAGEPVPSFGLTGLLSYPPAGIEAFLAIYFDGTNPADSLFIASMKEVSFLSFAEMLLWAADVPVPSLMLSALDTYGVYPLDLHPSQAQTTLDEDDFAALNAYQIPADFRAIVSELGFPMGPASADTDQTQLVLRRNDEDSNDEWFIADFKSGRIFHLARDAAVSPPYALSLDPWLYVAPVQTRFGTTTYDPGYGFGGQLVLPGVTLNVIAQLQPVEPGKEVGAWALRLDVTAPDPIVYPVDSGTVPALLVLSAPGAVADEKSGPSVSLATHRIGDVQPHFNLKAAVTLLSVFSASIDVEIVETGFSFDLKLDASLPTYKDGKVASCASAHAVMACLVNSDHGFEASFSLSVDFNGSTNPVMFGDTVVIPSLSLDVGMGLDLAVSFPYTYGPSIPDVGGASFDGTISFAWKDQSFSASIHFTLADLSTLMRTVGTWIVENMEELLSTLLGDVNAWTRALANGLFTLEADAAAAALAALKATYRQAAKLMAQAGYTVHNVYEALEAVYNVGGDELVEAITDAFRLKLLFAAVTQQVGPATDTDAQTLQTDPTALIGWLATTASDGVAKGAWSDLTQPASGATVAVSANLLGTATLDVTLADPGPYAAHFYGYGIDQILPYQRLDDTRGVFSTSLPNGAALKAISFGPFTFQFPSVTLSFYTDGGWILDCGYPDGGNRSAFIAVGTPGYSQMSGQGGFRLTNLSPGESPPDDWPPVSYSCAVHAEVELSYTGSVNLGMLTGGWSLTYTGGFSAIAGYGDGVQDNGTDGTDRQEQVAGPTPSQFRGTLTLGFSGALYGTVDFGIVSAAVHVSIKTSRSISLRHGQPVDLSSKAHVHVGAKIRIRCGLFTIVISFTYTADVDVGPPALAWSGQYAADMAVAAAAVSAARLSWARASDAAVSVLGTEKPPLKLWFVPELALAFGESGTGTPQAVFNLAIEYAEATPGCAFNVLVRTLLQWAMSLDGEGAAGATLSRGRLERLSQRLKARPRLSRLYAGDDPTTQLDYAAIVAFFQDCFAGVTIALLTEDADSAVTFAMIPDLVAHGGAIGGTSVPLCDFATCNMQSASFEDEIEAVNARFQLFSSDAGMSAPLVTADNVPASLATYVFLAFFEYLLNSGAGEAESLTATASLDEITADQWNALAFDQTAGGLTVSFRGGVQLSATGQAGQVPAPLYGLTGQQIAAATIAPLSDGMDLSVAAGAGGDWFTVADGTVVRFSADDLSAISGLTVVAPLSLVPQANLTASPTTYVFAGFTACGVATLAGVPADLAGTQDTVTLSIGATSDGTADPGASMRWGTLIPLTLRSVTLPDGTQDATVFALSDMATDQLTVLAELTDAIKAGETVTLALLLSGASDGYVDCAEAPGDCALLRTNLSTQSEPPSPDAAFAAMSIDADEDDAELTDATLADAEGALNILLAFAQTNTAGYFLSLAAADPTLTTLSRTNSTIDVALLASRGAAFKAGEATSARSSDTVLVVSMPPSDLNDAGLAATSTRLTSYQPAFASGVLPISVARHYPAAADSDANQNWLDQLYSPFTVAIQGDAYADLGYAPPCSPSSDQDGWHYFLSIPLNHLIKDGLQDDPYAAVGTVPTVVPQLRDAFGNAVVPDLEPFTVAQTYTDLLVGPASWTASRILWTPAKQDATLTVTLDVDKATLDSNHDTALALYTTASWQLNRAADVQFELSSTLDTGGVRFVDGEDQQAITDYVTAILDYLEGVVDDVPAPVPLTYPISAPTTAMPPQEIVVTLTLKRIDNLDPADTARLPGIAVALAPATADLSNGLDRFASAFQAVFPALLLASGTGSSGSGQLWTVAAGLLQPTISGKATYFAPAPLYTSLQSGAVAVPVYGDFSGDSWASVMTAYNAVDCDQMLLGAFNVIDQILGGAYAAAAYWANPASYRRLATGRAALAELYSANQLRVLFEEQASGGADDLASAVSAFTNCLQNALSNAYAIDGVLTFPAVWTALPDGWQGRALTLWGLVAPSDDSQAALAANATLCLSGSQAEATLSYMFQPGDLTADATVTVPLSYTVSNVAFQGDDGQLWLALAIPQTIKVGEDAVVVPVVDRFFPTAPGLDEQRAMTASGTAPSFGALFQWDYVADLGLQPVAQDRTTVTIDYNLPGAATEAPALARAMTTPALTLAEAVVRFQDGAAEIQPALPQLLSGGPNATNIVTALADLVDALRCNVTWNPAEAMRMDVRTASASTVVSTTLTVTLEAASADDPGGLWMMTVTVVGALPDGSTLSAVPLTVDGTAQPETMIVADDPLTVTYQPADCQAPVMVELSLSGLDLRLRHNGCATVVVERNADLMPNAGWTVSSDFILTTTPATFPQPVTPLVVGPGEGYDIATVVAEPESPTLANWLSALLSEVVGTAAQPRISATLGFRFAQYSGTDSAGTARIVYAVQPVTVSRTVVLGDDDGADVSLDGYATALANAFTAWANAKTVPTVTGEFLITLCLFSAGRTAGTALLQLPNLHLALGEVTA